MAILTVRIAGICCLVDARSGSADPFVKRVIIPVDTHGHDSPHIPYVEVEKDDIADSADLPKVPTQYVRSGGTVVYRRAELAGARITIGPVDPAAPDLQTMETYENHICHMKKVQPALDDHPKGACFDANPPAAVVAGCWDVQKGTLVAGPLFEFRTTYVPQHDHPTVRHAQWNQVLIPLSGAPVITLAATDGSSSVTIALKDTTRVITIGNQIVEDLENLPLPAGDDPSMHFSLFYNLAESEPAEKPLPARVATPAGGCGNTNWP